MLTKVSSASRWDQTGSNGANLSWPVDLGIPDTDLVPYCKTHPNECDDNAWMVGFVNSMPYFAIFFL
jgi:hypothetical protein